MPRRLESLSGIVMALSLCLSMGPAPVHAQWSPNPYNRNVVCGAPGAQILARSCPDGAGGAFVAWTDQRALGYDVYLTRLLPDGTAAPGWPDHGLGVATQPHIDALPELLPDGAGGVFIAWVDSTVNHYDIRLNRFDASGVLVPGWPAGGLPLSNSNFQEGEHRLASDGAGGVWVTWIARSTSNATEQVKAVRVNGNGAYAPGFAQGGVTYRSHASEVEDLGIIPDGIGGAYLAWIDHRNYATTLRDLYGQRILSNGLAAWSPQGLLLTAAAGSQDNATIASDGWGHCIVAWVASGDIYVQMINSVGTPQYFADLPICTAPNIQAEPQILWDGRNSYYVLWEDERTGTSRDVYVQRVGEVGIPLWTADGVAVATGSGDQALGRLALDGEGGVMIVWLDDRTLPFNYEIWAQRYTGAGTRLWATNGIPVARGTQFGWGDAVSDGRGGLIFASGGRTIPYSDIFAHRVDRYGVLGDPSPREISVKDVPNDQGGFVRVAWEASTHDTGPDVLISEYAVWRSVLAFEALAAIESGDAIMTGTRDAVTHAASAGASVAPRSRVFRTSVEAGETVYWEQIGTQNAHQLPAYSMVVPTTSDSINGSNPKTRFQVNATRDDEGTLYHWFSAPDSGYSVDNLVPPTPVPFVVNFQGPAKYLHWGPSNAPDLRGYIVYRGVTPDFELNGGTYVAEVQDTNFVDQGPADFYYYKLTAVDVHGNQSPPALFAPPGNVGVETPLATSLQFAPPNPNPSSGPVTLRWSQPAEAEVSLRVYDASGRMVRALASGSFAAGEHTVQWQVRSDEGAIMPPGLYFARLDMAGRSLVQRIARVR